VLGVVEAQMARHVAMDQRAGGDHLCVEQGVVREQAVQVAAVAVGPVHHGGNRKPPHRKFLLFFRHEALWHGVAAIFVFPDFPKFYLVSSRFA
jgi:hypothetical protein